MTTTIRPLRLLHDTLLRSAEATPEKVALVTGERRTTYAELLDAAVRFANAVTALGVRRGDRVALYLDNSRDCVVALYGTLLAGAAFVVVNPQTKEDKLEYILTDCEARVLVTEGPIAVAGLAAASRAPSVAATLVGERPAGADGGLDLAATLADASAHLVDAGTIALDLAALIYTSGSTGLPKGVMQTHQSMLFAAESIAQYLRLADDDTILGLLPLAFDYGLYQLLMSIRLGATLVLERSFAYPAQILKRIDTEQVTVFPGVPTVYATLLASHERSPIAAPSVRRVTNTAAALLPAMQKGLTEIFPNALIFAMYGLTECKRVSYLEPELLVEKPSSVGRAIPGTETIVLGADGNPVAPGETGTLYVRGPHVMLGYWRKPEQTAEMIVEGPLPGERMLNTNDLFTVDEDGFLYFVGRTDDIIKTRGEKVSPLEVENVLFAMPGIMEAAVVGVPDERLGEAIRAFVVAAEGTELTAQDVINHCRTHIESYMVPRDVVFIDEMPKTSSGKVRKKSLREPGAE
ncbi:MAG: class I adenylate-forming enzyme family protein [Gaiellales bacterium]